MSQQGTPKSPCEELKNRIRELEGRLEETQRTAEVLRRSEEKYRSILENIEDEYYEVDLEGNFTFLNQAACKNQGLSREDMIGQNFRNYTTPEEADRLFRVFLEAYRTGVPSKLISREAIRNDAAVTSFEDSVSLLRNASGEPIGFSAIGRNVTEKKKCELALRESEESYRSLLAAAPDAIAINRFEDGLYMEVNEAFCQLTGFSVEETIGRTSFELNLYVDPADRERLLKPLQDCGRVAGLEMQYRDKKGNINNYLVSARTLRFKGEDCLLVIAANINSLKKAQKSLKQSEEKYRLLVENANDGITILQDGMVKFSNPRMEELTGYSAKDLAGIPFVDLVDPKNKDAFVEQQRKKAEKKQLRGTYSFRMINKANETLWVDLNTIPIVWEGHPATLNILRDVTPQKKMEAQFLQAQKMEAVGTLAGGIAHDFNNLLMGIQGNASLITLDLEPHHPHFDKLRSIEQLVKGGAELTKQLLGIARRGKYEIKPTDINQLIERNSDLFGRTRKEIRIHRQLQEDAWVVEVDRSQIEQVLLNLYVNAWQAMPKGGNLFLETRNVVLDDYYVKPYGVAPGKFVRISVTDTGVGMDEETRKRAFDPFFTTKEMGRGTGLGLASAYGIIKNHKGLINVYSEKGEGSTFTIYLPVSEKKVQEVTDSREEIVKGTGFILFADDEEPITKIGKLLLERLGYQVTIARSGSEALEIYRREQSRIDLVILDMIMPEINGGDTFDRLKEIDPKVKVLLSSGYSLNGQARSILDRGCKGFIQKPFDIAELSKRVQQIMDEKRSEAHPAP